MIAWRGARGRGLAAGVPGAAGLLGLIGTATALFAVEVVVGALQIFTALAPWAVTLHLGLGAAVWALLAAATFYGYLEARIAGGATSPVGGGVGGRFTDREGDAGPAGGRRGGAAASSGTGECLRGAHQAAHHRAAAGDDRARR